MSKATVVRAGGGKDFDYSQDHCFVKLASTATEGQLSIVEDRLKPGFRLERHHHKQMTEVFYMLEGEMVFTFDDTAISLVAGDTLTIPPNTPHAAECKEGGRMLTIFLNGRFDQFLERLSGMTDKECEDPTLMKSLSEEFDIYEC